jgi:endonuclease/exonuclease/phosphatase family metal-dependent hydrolase
MTICARRRARLISAIFVVIGLLVAGVQPATAASAEGPQAGRHVTVMTRNLYLGADFTPLLTVPPEQLPAAVVAILADVQASQPALRMQQVANEIDSTSPDVVALQEAADWTSDVPGVPALQYSYNFTELVLNDLAAMGDHYTVAVDQANFDSLNDLTVGTQLPGRFVDHDVILVKQGTDVGRTAAAHFASQLTYSPTPIGPVTFTRGYVWADVKIPQGKVYRIVDTHLEAYSAAVAGTQADELLTALRGTRNPTLIAGDMNSDPALPSAAAAQRFTAAGYTDAWPAVHPTLPGYTCCQAGSLTGPADGSALDQRIDHIYAKGQATAISATLVGVVAFEATRPMWPSDHAGLVVSYGIGNFS